MTNKSIAVYLVFGVILGLAGALAYIMLFHNSVDKVAQAEGEEIDDEGWISEDPPGFPTIDVSKIYTPPDLTPVTPLPGEIQIYEATPRPAVATATAIAEEARKQSRLGPKVGGVHIGVFPSEVGDRFLHFRDGTYVPLPSDVRFYVFDGGQCGFRDASKCPVPPIYMLKNTDTGATIAIDATGKRTTGLPTDDPSQFAFLERDRRSQ